MSAARPTSLPHRTPPPGRTPFLGGTPRPPGGTPPWPREPARLDGALGASARPVLLVVVDTEEEFDWSAPFDRGATSVEAMRDVLRLQAVFEEFDARPVYVADWPVVTQPAGSEPLRELQDAGRAEVGAHLHPWVNPPHAEEVTARNSYPGNLPRELEAAKLGELTAAIEDRLGRRPTVYKAGRYGFGPRTAEILHELGYRVDLSGCPAFDLSGDGGPDWTELAPEPYWFGPDGALLGIPTTGAFVGWAAGAGAALYRAATRGLAARLRAPGILARLRAVERLHLSPEGYAHADHRRLVRHLLARGTRVFTLSLHSPSARPGCTPYVRSELELRAFLDTCRYTLEFLVGELGAECLLPSELRARLTPCPEPAAP